MKIAIYMSTFAVELEVSEDIYDSIKNAVTHGYPYEVKGIYFAAGKTQCIKKVSEE